MGEEVGARVGVALGEAVGVRVGVSVGVRLGEGRANTPVALPGIIWINFARMPLSLRLPTAIILWPTARLADEVAVDLDLITVLESKKTVKTLSR